MPGYRASLEQGLGYRGEETADPCCSDEWIARPQTEEDLLSSVRCYRLGGALQDPAQIIVLLIGGPREQVGDLPGLGP